jgi:hypothetical protein
MSVRILSFTKNESNQYKVIENRDIHRFKGLLPNYTMSDHEVIYLLMYKRKFLCEHMIGRCIVTDTSHTDDEEKEAFISILHRIPVEIMKEYPVIIEDLFIIRNKRNNGYGKYFIDHILNELMGCKISLKAEGDGLWFWRKIGFKAAGNNIFVK